MRKLILWLIVLYSFPLFSQERVLSFYNVTYFNENPIIDGVLNERVWQICKREKNFYKYWQTKPVKGEIQTEFMIFYNDRGIYFASINYDEYIDNIKATKTMRDDPELWMDDCNEIYFDPEGKGVGYFLFVVNFLGTKRDVRRIDTANIDDSWNLENWEYRTSKGENFWIVESFFPWSDIFKKPKEGELWMFNLVRYSFSTGKFRGVSWSLGGSYSTPEKFGYLYFSKSKDIDLNKIGKILSNNISPPWELPFNDGFLICKEKGKYKFLKGEEIFKEEKKKSEEIIKKIDEIFVSLKKDDLYKEFLKIKEEFEKNIEGEINFEKLKSIKDNFKELEEIYWNLKIEESLK